MGLTDYDREWLVKILCDLLNNPISKMFRRPVDPIKDGAPNYYDIINNFMMNNYLPRLCSFLDSQNKILLLNTIIMFSSLSMCDNEIVEFIVTTALATLT